VTFIKISLRRVLNFLDKVPKITAVQREAEEDWAKSADGES
jgi:hypothetical protein